MAPRASADPMKFHPVNIMSMELVHHAVEMLLRPNARKFARKNTMFPMLRTNTMVSVRRIHKNELEA